MNIEQLQSLNKWCHSVLKPKCFVLVLLLVSSRAYSSEVNSLDELKPFLSQDNVNVTLAAGIYTITASDIEEGKFSNPLFLFEGNNSIYDFTGVTINIETEVLQSFGNVDIHELQVVGNNNVLKNLTMVDVGSKRPTKRATNIAMDGANNRIEGFHLTVRGSFPYGYGDAFGKGGKSIIRHYKHSAIVVRGNKSHLKNTTIIHRAYGHAIFMQAASDPIIEGCYVEGEVRSTDDMLAEKGTGSPADKIDFMTVWGYKLPAGYTMSLQEEGIRAYNAGETMINGVEHKRGTNNVTILNCKVKNMRGGVTITHATGTKYVEGCTVIGCERGYAIGSGKIVNCSGDAQYGALFGVDYSRDRNIEADITVLPSDISRNGSKLLAYIGGQGHKLTFKSAEGDSMQPLDIKISGFNNSIRVFKSKNTNDLTSTNIEINNQTNHPITLAEKSSGTTGESCGKITDFGSDNSVQSSTLCLDEKRRISLTTVSIQDEKFLINGIPTYKERMWKGYPVEGLLMNSRMVQGIFDDLNPETADRWKYDDTQKWDSNRNTDEFVSAMDSWYAKGLLGFSINMQGGSPLGYGNKGWINSAYDSKGALRPEYMARLEKILNKADDIGMVAILGLFYNDQEDLLEDEEAVLKAVDNVIAWLFDNNYQNVIIEINNECNLKYRHEILQPQRVHEVVERIKSKKKYDYSYLVSTSYSGGEIPRENVVRASDFLLIHGNVVHDPARISEMVQETKAVKGYKDMPIVFNEDDHFNFKDPANNFTNAIKAYASWGYFDYRMKGEGYENGFQSVPVNWGISSKRKKSFFKKLKQITGGLD